MGARLKKTIIILIVVIIAAGIAVPISNVFIKNKIASALKKLPNHVKVQVDDISVNALSGSISLKGLDVTVLGKTTGNENLKVKLNSVFINDLSYKDYLFNKKISIDNIEVNQPQITYYHDSVEKKKENSQDSFLILC